MTGFERVGDRNQSLEFARRTLKNLEFIVSSRGNGEDVHVVTQSVVSLLGLLIFPWERSAIDAVKKKKLPVLSSQGWPKWDMTGRRVVNVGDLVELLRNSTTHGNVVFDSDSPEPANVMVMFSNHPNGRSEADWSGKIRGDHLIDFCQRFLSSLIGHLE